MQGIDSCQSDSYLTFELKNLTEEEEYCKVQATLFKYDEDWNCIEFIRIKGSAIMFHEKYSEIEAYLIDK